LTINFNFLPLFLNFYTLPPLRLCCSGLLRCLVDNCPGQRSGFTFTGLSGEPDLYLFFLCRKCSFRGPVFELIGHLVVFPLDFSSIRVLKLSFPFSCPTPPSLLGFLPLPLSPPPSPSVAKFSDPTPFKKTHGRFFPHG